MTPDITAVLQNIDTIISSLKILFPGFLAYFVYVGLRAPEFEEMNRTHLVIILLFTLFFEIIQDLSGSLMNMLPYELLFYFVFPVLLGVISDISHRLFVTRVVNTYQDKIVKRSDSLQLIDVGNVSRWQKTLEEYVWDSLGKITTEYYVEVQIDQSSGGSDTKRGFLNGYSEDDIEIIRYDDLSEKEFPEVGDLDINPDELTMAIDIIPRDKIASIRIYRVRMDDFALQ